MERCIASMFVRQVERCFPAVRDDGFPGVVIISPWVGHLPVTPHGRRIGIDMRGH